MFKGANGGYYGVAIAQQAKHTRPAEVILLNFPQIPQIIFHSLLPFHLFLLFLHFIHLSPIGPVHILPRTSPIKHSPESRKFLLETHFLQALPQFRSTQNSLKILPTHNLTSHQSPPKKRRCPSPFNDPEAHLPPPTFHLSLHIVSLRL